MVRLIDVLEGRGHVERTRDREDRRRYQLTLTPRGKKAVGRCDAILAAVTDDVLAALSPDERRTLHRLTLRALGYPAEIPEMVVVVPALAERQ